MACDRCGALGKGSNLKKLSLCITTEIGDVQDFQPLPSTLSDRLCNACIKYVKLKYETSLMYFGEEE